MNAINILKTRTKEFFSLWRHYSLPYAWYSILWWFCFYTRPPFCYRLSTYAIKKKTAWLDKYFNKNYSHILNKYKDCEVCGTIVKNPKIWVFWGQGETHMPPLVKACYRQLTHYNKNVILITNNNIKEYIELPEIIFEKVHNGKISWAHFSDIVRNTLLAKHGGLWIDATVWVSGEISFKDLLLLEVFSANSKVPVSKRATRFWTSFEYNWSTWCMWSKDCNNKLYSFVSRMLTEIALKEIQWPDYVIQDYLIYYAARNIQGVKEMLEQSSTVPCKKRNELATIMNDPFDKNIYNKLIEKDFVFKLSFRANWKNQTKEGKQTFYGRILENTI